MMPFPVVRFPILHIQVGMFAHSLIALIHFRCSDQDLGL